MKIYHKFLTLFLTLLGLLAVSLPASAITDEEMDHARAIAAKYYLRWANNGSDYLDPLDPKSMNELEGKLKQKEKENIKAFKSVATPSDYSKWDKDQVVTYWSETFFKASGLNEQGRGARSQVKKRLQSVSFSAPAAAPAKPETPSAAAEVPVQPAEPALDLPSAAPEPENVEPVVPSAEEVIAETQALDSAAQTEPLSAVPEEKSSDSSNWLYIVALIVLVGIVVWLVIFASRTMQNSSKAAKDAERAADDEERREEFLPEAPVRRGHIRNSVAPAAPAASVASAVEDAEENESIIRDRFARRIASKDTEIHELQRQVRDLRDENLRLADENSKLNSDLLTARRELETLRSRAKETQDYDAPVAARHAAVVETPEVPVSRPRGGSSAREIFLGRVNAKGIFVRADRQPVDGKSVFVLSTTDSYTGTYRILQTETTINMALENPEYYLAGGCVAADILDNEEAEAIRTVAAGTAIFEDGCWRVLRKAKIAYE